MSCLSRRLQCLAHNRSLINVKRKKGMWEQNVVMVNEKALNVLFSIPINFSKRYILMHTAVHACTRGVPRLNSVANREAQDELPLVG